MEGNDVTATYTERDLALLIALGLLLAISPAKASAKEHQLSAPGASALDPSSIHYLGAFRPPENGQENEDSFSYSGEALAFSPNGNRGQAPQAWPFCARRPCFASSPAVKQAEGPE